MHSISMAKICRAAKSRATKAVLNTLVGMHGVLRGVDDYQDFSMEEVQSSKKAFPVITLWHLGVTLYIVREHSSVCVSFCR